MPQNEHIERHQKKHGYRLDYFERKRKKEARSYHENAEKARKLTGIKAKIYNKERFKEKVQLKKTLKMNEEKKTKKDVETVGGDIPIYLLNRKKQENAELLSTTIKQKRLEKAGKWEVPIPKVKQVSEKEAFRVQRSGKTKRKAWKRVITKMTFVDPGFTRKAPKYERFIKPMALRLKRANVTSKKLGTFNLPILGVKKNPNSTLYTGLGIITKGTIIEVDVSEIGMVTPGGKIVYGSYAQVTNVPENEGCCNAILLE
uniref:Ribosome biogenesis protein NSA2 homolog n=1 Tax=Dugesia japonica TaxID=6161 RepID=A0A2L1IV00_DUGJA|nr:TGF beta inducible nuclear protein [Dugesia japonica]